MCHMANVRRMCHCRHRFGQTILRFDYQQANAQGTVASCKLSVFRSNYLIGTVR